MTRLKASASRSTTSSLQASCGAPFDIYFEEEKSRYLRFNNPKIKFCDMDFLDDDLIEQLGFSDKINGYLKTLGWEKFAKMRFPDNDDDDYDLVKEFLVSFFYDKDTQMISFRNLGKDFAVGYDEMHSWFGFPYENFATKPKKFDYNPVWKKLSNLDSFCPKNTSNRSIRDACDLYFFKFLTSSLFGRVETARVHAKDFFVFDCLFNGFVVDSVEFFFEAFAKIISSKTKEIPLCNFITGIVMAARGTLNAYQLENHDNLPKLDYEKLLHASLVKPAGIREFLPFELRKPTNFNDDENDDVPTTVHPEIPQGSQEPGWQQVLHFLQTNTDRLEGKLDEVIRENNMMNSALGELQSSVTTIRDNQNFYNYRLARFMEEKPNYSPPAYD